jgi:hypothetical protein
MTSDTSPSNRKNSDGMKAPNPVTVAAPVSPKPALSRSSENSDHDENMNPEQLVYPDHAVSQALGEDFTAFSECSSSCPLAANSEGERTAWHPGNAAKIKWGGAVYRTGGGPLG